jgi:hypothetical protein
MRTVNIYFQAVTKVSMGTLNVSDDESIEDLMALWMKQGYARVHYQNNSIYIYIPWVNIIYCQYDRQYGLEPPHQIQKS